MAYWPALEGDVLWDDPGHLTDPELQSLDGLQRIWTDARATQQYYPVLHSAFWLEHKMWGDATWGYHLANILQHALACCLLAFVVLRLQHHPTVSPAGASSPPEPAPSTPLTGTLCAWGGALLMALHPVAVESVAWISEQKNTLSTLFYFSAALAYLGFTERRTARRYAGATLCFLLAVGSKTVTCTLPAALLVVLWWRHGRLELRRDVAPLLPWFVVAIAAGLGTAWVERNLIGADGADYALTILERVLLAGRIVWFYLGSAAWPADLAFFYERWDVPALAPSWWPFLAASLVVTAIAVCVALRWGFRGPLAAWLLWVGTLFPALGFFNVFPFAFSYVADHFQYLATFSLIGAGAIGATKALARTPRPLRQLAWGGVAAIGLTFLLLTRSESRHYRSNVALFSASVAVVPENWMAQRCLGWALSKIDGRDAEAIRHYRESLRLKPDSPDSCNGLAVLLLRSPETRAEALTLLQRAIELRPHFAEPHYSLATLLRDQPDRADEMIRHLEIALDTKPRFAAARLLLAETLARIPERHAEAALHFNEALHFDPSLAAAHLGLGRLLISLPGRSAEAESRFRRALALDPDLAAAHFELGNLLASRPDAEDAAVAHYEQSLRLQPDSAAAHFNLANLLARVAGRTGDALSHYQTALTLEPKSAEIHGNLGNALAQLGRPTDAIAHYQQALALDPNLAWIHQNLALALAPQPAFQTEALHHAREAVRLAPRSAEAYNTLALVHAQRGALVEARDAWQKVLELAPGFSAARENLARVNQMLNR